MFTTVRWKTTLALQKQHELRAAELRYYSLGRNKGKEGNLFQGKTTAQVREPMRILQSIFISQINKT